MYRDAVICIHLYVFKPESWYNIIIIIFLALIFQADVGKYIIYYYGTG